MQNVKCSDAARECSAPQHCLDSAENRIFCCLTPLKAKHIKAVWLEKAAPSWHLTISKFICPSLYECGFSTYVAQPPGSACHRKKMCGNALIRLHRRSVSCHRHSSFTVKFSMPAVAKKTAAPGGPKSFAASGQKPLKRPETNMVSGRFTVRL